MTQTIIDIRGIGPALQISLAKHGFVTVDDLAKTTVERLIVTPGISEIKATQVIADARNLLAIIVPSDNVMNTKKKNKAKDKKSAKKSKKDKNNEKKGKEKAKKSKKKTK